jgi:hypothetical protein
MLLPVSTNTPSSSPAYKNSIHNTLKVFLLPLQLLHLLCILCGPLVTIGYLIWAMLLSPWSIVSVSEALPTLSGALTPWQACKFLGVTYSWFVWLFYVLPTWTKEVGHAHLVREFRFPQQTLWKHMVLWGLVFGPLLHHYARAADLSVPLLIGIVAGLVWGFHEIVWRDVRWVRQHCRESYRRFTPRAPIQ